MKVKVKDVVRKIPIAVFALLAAVLIVASARYIYTFGERLECERSLYVCDKYNIQEFKEQGVNCEYNYKSHGLFADSTQYICEGYGDVRRSCVKGHYITAEESNLTACH